MHGYEVAQDDPHALDQSDSSWVALIRFFGELRARLVLLVVTSVVFLLMTGAVYFALAPKYTASAVVGPPPPSPTSAMMSSFGGSAAGGSMSLVRRLIGGGGGSSTANDPFQEYLQLLQSVRLAQILVERDHILQTLYPDRWDAQSNRWKPPGQMRMLINAVMRSIGLPVKETPDMDNAIEFLQRNVLIGTSSKSSRTSTFLQNDSYPAVSVIFDNPQTAVRLLNTVLLEADNIIRDDLERDVSARLKYLRGELQQVAVADQRDSLISILSTQEQMQMMLKADKRFASTLIDAPYASEMPTSPLPFPKFMLIMLFLSGLTWVALVFLSTKIGFVRVRLDRLESLFGKRPRNRLPI